MKIPVFVSCPTQLSKAQNVARERILAQLAKLQLEPRAIGRSDYPTQLPLREVLTLARHCSGGVILGFSQFEAESGIAKRGTREQKRVGPIVFPSPWNNLEAGVLFSLGLPLIVFRERISERVRGKDRQREVSGGIFDLGVTDVFLHPLPSGKLSRVNHEGLSAVFLKWQASVRAHYYRERPPGGEQI